MDDHAHSLATNDTEQQQYGYSHGGSTAVSSTLDGDPEKPLHSDHAPSSDDEKQATGAPAVGEPPRNVHGFAWFLVVLSTLSANFLFALDNTIVADVQPAIVRDFGSLDKISWLSVAFLLAAAGTNFFWGDIYARFSVKWTFCSAVVLFAVGSAICGAAPNMDALIVGRAICGWGGAGMYIGSMTVMTVCTTERERPLYLSIVGVTWGLGTVLGPIIGGAFTDSNATWRWAFYLNLVVGGVCAPIYIFMLPTKNPRPGQGIARRWKEIDFIGVVLNCAFWLCLIMAISFGGTVYAWNSGSVIALFVVAGVILIGMLLQQYFCLGTTEEHRIFPLTFLGNSVMMTLFVEVVTAATCVFIPIYFIPLFFQFAENDGALEAGVRLLPFVAFQVTVTVASGFIIGKTGYYMPWYYAAGILCIPGAVLMWTVQADTSLAKIYGYQILLATGAGCTVQTSFAVAQFKAEPSQIPRALGFCTLAQLAGPAIALSIANAVFLNKATLNVSALLPGTSTVDVQGAISNPQSPVLSSLSAGQKAAVIDAIVSAMRNVYIIVIVAACLTLILAFRFRPNENLFRPPQKNDPVTENKV